MTTSELLERISINNSICHGKPCIKETRVMVHQVLELIAADIPVEEITSEKYFPHITKEDVRACVAFANQLVKNEEIQFYESRKAV